VIGGGPAGMLAAGTAGKNKKNKVTLIEKNEKLGKKLYITGKGRCNITNACDVSDFLEFITTNKNFMYSSLYSFTNENIIDLLEKYGVETKIERGNRVFPLSDKSSDVIDGLKKYLNENNVDVRLNTEVDYIEFKNDLFYVYTKNEKTYTFNKIVIATGGVSYKATGSTGDGYKFSKNFGHNIVDPKASLVPINLKDSFINDLQGLSLRNVTLKVVNEKNKVIHEEFGEMLFTHFGISGPIVLTISNYINSIKSKMYLQLDLKPSLDYEKLDNRLLRDFEKYSNKQFKNSLDDLLPKKIIPVIIEKSDIDEEKTVHQITKEERQNLVRLIKNFPLQFNGFRDINTAIVTSGGIDVDEINPSTMESKLQKGLFFAGEVIDVDALTGGFNLQIAYSTGFLAGSNL
ncbi:MAG TPA: NAD(P)/FAD-dependent oxidoreductase, partial [Tissierellaceae bacterium]